jgi:hypothetical protein
VSDSALAPGCDHISEGTSGCNLYESECPAGCSQPGARVLTDLSAGDVGHVEDPQVEGVMAVSSDGTHVYFMARSVLTDEANSDGARATEGSDNLYVYSSTTAASTGRLGFIATLSDADNAQWREGPVSANVTPDGEDLVFASQRGLTPDAGSGEGASQIYAYDDQEAVLRRISIGDQGFNDDGNNGAGDARIVPAHRHYNAAGPAQTDPTMSADGRYVFFESPIALTPMANDDVVIGHTSLGEAVYAQNVYEWRSVGTRSCTEPSGCVSLISFGEDRTRSSGAGPFGSESDVALIGSDASGQNVFFTTSLPLVPSDTDTQVDYYDARIGGGFPLPAPQHPCSSGAECHGADTTGASGSAGGSLTFSAPGNQTTLISPLEPVRVKLTNAQKRVTALKECRRKFRARKHRTACERSVRRRYPVKKKKAAAHKPSSKKAKGRN